MTNLLEETINSNDANHAAARRTHRRGKAGCECDHYAIVPDKLRAAHNSPPVLKVGFAILAKF